MRYNLYLERGTESCAGRFLSKGIRFSIATGFGRSSIPSLTLNSFEINLSLVLQLRMHDRSSAYSMTDI